MRKIKENAEEYYQRYQGLTADELQEIFALCKTEVMGEGIAKEWNAEMGRFVEGIFSASYYAWAAGYMYGYRRGMNERKRG